MRRRNFIKGLSLGACAGFLGPSIGRLISEAHGEELQRKRLIVLTDGNGWGHQGQHRNSPVLDAEVKADGSWDLPKVLDSWGPWRERVTICKPLDNRYDRSLHGNGWATLSAIGGNGSAPGGVSIDRFVAKKIGLDDPFPSIAFGVSVKEGRLPVCTSADGPLRPFPAFGAPMQGYQALFGGSGGDVTQTLMQEKSLLDAMVGDLRRVQGSLAPSEKVKLEQLIESYRVMERRFATQEALFAENKPPKAPSSKIVGTLNGDALEAQADLIAQAMSFGLTHVAHMSVMGRDAHNPGWGFLGYGGDAHENMAHGAGYKGKSTEAYSAVISYKAELMARIYKALEKVPQGNGTMADNTLIMWVNSGGGKHHHGASYHPVVMLGDAGGEINAGQYLTFPKGKHAISDAFVAVANALGAKADKFGNLDTCQGPLPGLLT